MGRLRNKIKKRREIKSNERMKRLEDKEANKTKRKATKRAARTNKKATRVGKRQNLSQARTMKRYNKKLSKKYGDFDPNEAQALASVSPYQDAMNDYLQEKGIPVENPDDELEVAAKYAQLNPDINDPLNDDIYDDAFVNDDDHYEGMEGYENFDWKKTALEGVKGAVKGIGASIKQNVNDTREKERSGGTLTDSEKRLLDADDKVRSGVKSVVKDAARSKFNEFAPLVVLLLIAVIVFKR